MEGNLTPQEKIERQKYQINRLMWLPIMLLLGIIPLIVRMLVIYPDAQVADVLNTYEVYDVYSNFKETGLVVLCILMVVLIFLVFDKKELKKDKFIKTYIIGSSVFIGISLIATLNSNYPHTAWWGMPDRAEGFVTQACYIFIMLYTLYSFREYHNFKYIIYALSFLVVISTIIGAFQYFGHDLFMEVEFFKNLILSDQAKEMGLVLTSSYAEKKVFGTMFHYNYMGSFGAMMVPLFLTLTLFLKGRKKKILCGIMTLCSMFLLFGSTSRAGLIGLVCAILIGMIIFAKVIVKKWQFTIPVAAILAMCLIGFNMITGGTIFSRIPTLIKDSIELFSGSDESFDYKDYIPVREIVHNNGTERIVFQTGTLILSNENNGLSFTDEAGNPIEYNYNEEGLIVTSDERFSYVTFKNEEVSVAEGVVPPVLLSMQVNGMDTFYFLLHDEKGVVLSDSCPIQEIEIDDPETVGFKGKEKLGSARGYIWSRSIPMMKKTVFVGFGPDTYALEFPQNDYLGKWWAYDTPNMIVDKAHSLYLALFVNNGGLALLGFLVVMGAYLIQSLKLYALKGYYESKDIIGIAVALAVVGYLGAGVFNDSIISVAPIFWVLVGTGMGINYWIYKERKEQEKSMRKVVAMRK